MPERKRHKGCRYFDIFPCPVLPVPSRWPLLVVADGRGGLYLNGSPFLSRKRSGFGDHQSMSAGDPSGLPAKDDVSSSPSKRRRERESRTLKEAGEKSGPNSERISPEVGPTAIVTVMKVALGLHSAFFSLPSTRADRSTLDLKIKQLQHKRNTTIR